MAVAGNLLPPRAKGNRRPAKNGICDTARKLAARPPLRMGGVNAGRTRLEEDGLFNPGRFEPPGTASQTATVTFNMASGACYKPRPGWSAGRDARRSEDHLPRQRGIGISVRIGSRWVLP